MAVWGGCHNTGSNHGRWLCVAFEQRIHFSRWQTAPYARSVYVERMSMARTLRRQHRPTAIRNRQATTIRPIAAPAPIEPTCIAQKVLFSNFQHHRISVKNRSSNRRKYYEGTVEKGRMSIQSSRPSRWLNLELSSKRCRLSANGESVPGSEICLIQHLTIKSVIHSRRRSTNVGNIEVHGQGCPFQATIVSIET